MSTIEERVAAALTAETGEAVIGADATRSPFSGYWTGQAESPCLRSAGAP